MTENSNYLMLVSPFKESKFDKKSWKRFQDLGDVVVLSKDVNFYDELMKKYNDVEIPEYVVGLSGDGGNNKFGKFASEKNRVFCPNTCGTGNDIARSLGFTKSFYKNSDEYLSLLENGNFETKKFDVVDFSYETLDGIINDKAFIGVPLGILAEVGDVGTFSKKIFGNSAYVLNGIKRILTHKPFEVAIEANGNEIYEGYISGGYAINTGTSGGSKFGVPGENPFDGKMSLVYFPTEKKAKKIKLLGLANNLANCDDHPEEITVIRGVKNFKITSMNSSYIPLGADGEVLPDCYEVEGKLMPGASEMYVAPGF